MDVCSVKPGQAGKVGQHQPHEKQQRDMRSLAPEEEQLQAQVQAGEHMAVKQLCRGGPGGPGGQQAEQEVKSRLRG